MTKSGNIIQLVFLCGLDALESGSERATTVVALCLQGANPVYCSLRDDGTARWASLWKPDGSHLSAIRSRLSALTLWNDKGRRIHGETACNVSCHASTTSTDRRGNDDENHYEYDWDDYEEYTNRPKDAREDIPRIKLHFRFTSVEEPCILSRTGTLYLLYMHSTIESSLLEAIQN